MKTRAKITRFNFEGDQVRLWESLSFMNLRIENTVFGIYLTDWENIKRDLRSMIRYIDKRDRQLNEVIRKCK